MPAPMQDNFFQLASSVQGNPGIYIAAKLGGCDVKLLVDTGAQVSIIPKQRWLTITNGGAPLEHHEGVVRVANGGSMLILGRWQTVCQFDSLTVITEFLVADLEPQEILLGSDFLLKYGVIINLDQKSCRLMGKQIPLLVGNNNGMQPCDVIVHVDTSVPPRSEVLITGAVEGVPDSLQGMLEPSSSLYNHCDLLVARVVCRVEQGILPVRVINVTDDTHILKRGMKVGKLSFDVVVEGGGVVMANRPTFSVDTLIDRLNLHEKGFGEAETRAVRELLYKNLSVFSVNDADLGRTQLITHQIETGNAKPIKLPPRRVPLHLQEEVAEHIKGMQVNGIVQPSCSPWGAPVVPVRKKDGTLRFCVDYRRLNDVTRKDAYPLPRIDDALDSLAHAQWFSTLDLASGYWQVEVDPRDKHKTAFITRQGLFEFNVLSFGLCNAPSTFQRLMDLVLADLQWTTCLVYLDDIIVFGRTFGEHLQRLDEVLGKLRHANLKVKPSKCALFATQVRYLGHVISADGIRADPDKIDAVRQWPVPKNQTEVRSFVGLASYYRRFIEGFAEIARPLHRLTEKGRKFKWDGECQRAFLQLKTALVTTPVLAYPDPHKAFILDTDASDVGIGAVLSQEVDGLERVVAYASRALTKQERRYATTKKELLSLVVFTKYFKHYLLGKEFILRTDHSSLRWLHNFQGLEGQLARWVEQLASFQYKIVHRPGQKHVNADALSRLPSFGAKCEDLSDPRVEVSASVCAVCETAPSGEIEDELVGAQKKDAVLQIVEQLWLRGEEGRAEAQTKVEVRGFLPVWDQLEFERGRLVRKPPLNTDAALKMQVVLPKVMVPEVLKMLHNSATGGHLGVQKLQAKVKDRFYWPGWFEDVKKWCRECTECASRKSSAPNIRAPLQPSFVSRPFERVALDILGPLPLTGDKNKYILVIGDYFSKWTEAVALPNQEAVSIAKVLVQEWVCRFGVPRSIHSDQGRNFESKLFTELCGLLQMHKTRTTSYHPQSNGMVERFNRTLLSMLSLFVDSNQQNWDTLLPYVMMAYRSSTHATTGFSPYKVLFGREIVLPVDVVLGVGETERYDSTNDYVEKVAESLSTVVEAVKAHQLKASGRQKRCFDLKVSHQFYTEGELVWVKNRVRKRGLCPKLQRHFVGPFVVLERVTDVLYRIAPKEKGLERVVHFNRLKPYVFNLFSGRPELQSVERDRMSAVAGERSTLHPDPAPLADSARCSDPTLCPDSALPPDPGLDAVMPSVSTLLPAPTLDVVTALSGDNSCGAVPSESVARESWSGINNRFAEGRSSRARRVPAHLLDYDLSA